MTSASRRGARLCLHTACAMACRRWRLAAFDADRDEPAGFCMPLGTPRNTLSGTSALEVLQTADRVYFVFQPNLLNAETRRVYLDGRPLPPEEKRLPTWLRRSGISNRRAHCSPARRVSMHTTHSYRSSQPC